MKMTTKLLASAVAAVAIFFTTNVNAQSEDSKATRLGIGLSGGIPTTKGYDVALGADLRLQKDFSSNISGLLSAGYTRFVRDAADYGFVPLKAGVKIFFAESAYFSGELGAGIGTNEGSNTAFLWAPGIGYGWDNGLDLGLRYEGAEFKGGGSLGQVALRVAYGFTL
jgi:hypothetical protein